VCERETAFVSPSRTSHGDTLVRIPFRCGLRSDRSASPTQAQAVLDLCHKAGTALSNVGHHTAGVAIGFDHESGEDDLSDLLGGGPVDDEIHHLPLCH
jgi:hypothetical protein